MSDRVLAVMVYPGIETGVNIVVLSLLPGIQVDLTIRHWSDHRKTHLDNPRGLGDGGQPQSRPRPSPRS